MMGKALLTLLLLGACVVRGAEIYDTMTMGIDLPHLVTRNVDYKDGATSLRGYLAYTNVTMSQEGKPGVLIVPDWDGIGGYETWRAKLLATLGYVAFVADVFGTAVKQGPTMTTAERSAQTRIYSGNPLVFRQRLSVALDQLRDVEVVDEDMLAAIGYCFGGGGILEMVRSWPNGTDGLQGVMGFHPSGLVPVGSATKYGCPIRVSLQNGYLDPGANVTNLEAVQVEMTKANVTFETVRYGQTVHAFTEPDLAGATGGTVYNEIADMRSWSSLRSFLRDIFEVTDMSNFYTSPSDSLDGVATASIG